MDKTQTQLDKTQPANRINNQIKANRILIINDSGEKEKEVPFFEALARASDANMDLVQVGQTKDAAVCRIFDYSKFLYQEKKKKDKQNAKSRTQEVKAMNFRPGIGDNDFKIKIKKINEFLEEGHRVKIVIRLKNREFTMREMNETFVNKIFTSMEEFGVRDGNISYTNKEIGFLVRPHRKEKEVK